MVESIKLDQAPLSIRSAIATKFPPLRWTPEADDDPIGQDTTEHVAIEGLRLVPPNDIDIVSLHKLLDLADVLHVRASHLESFGSISEGMWAPLITTALWDILVSSDRDGVLLPQYVPNAFSPFCSISSSTNCFP
jgi:hypothetical protein